MFAEWPIFWQILHFALLARYWPNLWLNPHCVHSLLFPLNILLHLLNLHLHLYLVFWMPEHSTVTCHNSYLSLHIDLLFIDHLVSGLWGLWLFLLLHLYRCMKSSSPNGILPICFKSLCSSHLVELFFPISKILFSFVQISVKLSDLPEISLLDAYFYLSFLPFGWIFCFESITVSWSSHSPSFNSYFIKYSLPTSPIQPLM